MSNRWRLVLIVCLTLAAVLVDLPVKWQIKPGLDLAGGTELTLRADMDKITPADRKDALESLKGVIQRRVDLYGVAEPVIRTAQSGNDYRVIVELAGVTDVNEALKLVGKTAELTFREEILASEAGVLTSLSGKDLRKAEPSFNSKDGEPVVQLSFNDAGAKKWEEITRRNLNKRIAIVLDDQVLLAPTVVNIIADGQTIITGGFTAADTKRLAALLNSGALPAPVRVEQQRTIGATLGQESINKSLTAGLVGLGAVALFMIVSYGLKGLFADLALVIYILLTLAVFKLVPVTLTLAGIAGFILSVGMAVDANILIFERIREEIKWGRSKLAALEVGFSRAFPSIRDSNVSSLITCAILYWFGTGSVRGFALTLAIGIIVSLFTAITVTKTFLRLTNRSD